MNVRPAGPDGVLLVDKPEKLTSHDVVDVARRLLFTRRVGHTGTLDPAATGLLVLCVGRAGRLQSFLTGWDKTYEGTVVFGVATDTYDAEGTPAGDPHPAPAPDPVLLAEACRALTGGILQVPPPFSAKKIAGRKFYELARARARARHAEGRDGPVPRDPRPRRRRRPLPRLVRVRHVHPLARARPRPRAQRARTSGASGARPSAPSVSRTPARCRRSRRSPRRSASAGPPGCPSRRSRSRSPPSHSARGSSEGEERPRRPRARARGSAAGASMVRLTEGGELPRSQAPRAARARRARPRASQGRPRGLTARAPRTQFASAPRAGRGSRSARRR